MKVASLFAVLTKRLGIHPAGWEEVLPSHPTLGDVDSAAALASYQATKRAMKAEMRAAKGTRQAGLAPCRPRRTHGRRSLRVVVLVVVVVVMLMVVVVHPRREGDPDEQPLGAEDPRRGLAPWLLVRVAEDAMTRRAQLLDRWTDRLGGLEVELEPGLGGRDVVGPLSLPKVDSAAWESGHSANALTPSRLSFVK